MQRRTFLAAAMISPLALAGCDRATRPVGAASNPAVAAMQKNWRALLASGVAVPVASESLRKTESEWKAILSQPQYEVLREEATEPAFSSSLDAEKRSGVFVCAGCGLPLFTSAMKFDSGTGWPSFFTHIPDHLGTRQDYKLLLPRTEYHCIRCGGHQGHVFNDGPPPTGQRWCNNGVALRFIPA
jgi:peptide-methionine (R)-S-oxide reductase